MEIYSLTRQTTETGLLIDLYKNLQNKQWGKSSIVEGYYFVGHISPIIIDHKGREQAIATVYWKPVESDYFNTAVTFEIPLGPLYNNSSDGACCVSMDLLIGLTIHIIGLKVIKLSNKTIYSVIWDIAEELPFPPDDVIYDEFYRNDREEDLLLTDEFSQEDVVNEEENF